MTTQQFFFFFLSISKIKSARGPLILAVRLAGLHRRILDHQGRVATGRGRRPRGVHVQSSPFRKAIVGSPIMKVGDESKDSAFWTPKAIRTKCREVTLQDAADILRPVYRKQAARRPTEPRGSRHCSPHNGRHFAGSATPLKTVDRPNLMVKSRPRPREFPAIRQHHQRWVINVNVNPAFFHATSTIRLQRPISRV